ncbi:hypothetical protein O181_026245 [Austropuccinia psidii MF-1]|uniref:Uncharacterized protein n=1 Tax=Austropuccinia psidii MF-1 TaxID=1389203 RepID=A0A9Q3CP09_9BASI|nr:hypothetical protein [Austropuccinia psidii MF-1]
MKECLIKISSQFREASASYNEELGEIKVHEVERPYPPLLRRPAYPAIPRAVEELDCQLTELMKQGVLRNSGNNEEV